MRFSANLGFLWPDLPLIERIHAAARAGFDAVECHFPYDTPPAAVAAALEETGLPMLGLNTRPGDRAAGEFGLAALPGREAEARAAIEEAVDYAAAIGCQNVHVMAGRSAGRPGAREAFVENLSFAAGRAAAAGLMILIEPINTRDVPGYFLQTSAQAAALIAETDPERVRLMFDCYHLQIMEGDLLARFTEHRAIIGHVQFAAVPSRAEPLDGELNYPWLLPAIAQAGYSGYFGAEYRPAGDTDIGLGWLARLRGPSP